MTDCFSPIFCLTASFVIFNKIQFDFDRAFAGQAGRAAGNVSKRNQTSLEEGIYLTLLLPALVSSREATAQKVQKAGLCCTIMLCKLFPLREILSFENVGSIASFALGTLW